MCVKSIVPSPWEMKDKNIELCKVLKINHKNQFKVLLASNYISTSFIVVWYFVGKIFSIGT